MKTKRIFNLASIGLLTLGLFVSSCSDEDFDENIVESSLETKKVFFMGDEHIAEVQPDGMLLIGGDMLVGEEEISYSADDWDIDYQDAPGQQRKIGVAGGIRKWPDNTIIYVLDGSLTANQIEVTRNSMNEWSSKTAVRFKERTNESFYVTIRNNGNQCNCASASLGVQGIRGTINMGVRTSEVVMIHEIGHTLGYVHEQTRSDRDRFVDIFFENIQDGAESQFRLNQRAELIGEFDIASTMMYGAFTFSKNGQATIRLKNGNTHPRRRPELSAGDIAATNIVYPGNTTDPDPDPDPTPTDDICEGVDEWVRGQRYQVGDQVTFRGFLFERDFTRWNNLGRCGTQEPSADICEDVAPFNGNNSSYSTGDTVTYRGSLYERLSNGRWRNLGECGN